MAHFHTNCFSDDFEKPEEQFPEKLVEERKISQESNEINPGHDRDTQDPFDILGMDPCFLLDKNQLDHRYERIQQCCHPDLWTQYTIKNFGQKMAMRVTWAYGIILNPVTRAEALLKRRSGLFWPLKNFPDLMLDFFKYQEEWERQQQNSCHDDTQKKDFYPWQKRWDQAVKEFCDALAQDEPELAQRAYWWILHLGKYSHQHNFV